MASVSTTNDTLLNGQIRLRQPARGYRAGIDPILLAASVDPDNGQAVADLGTGVGSAALCLAYRVPSLKIAGFEVSRTSVALALENVSANGVQDRVTIACADVLDSRALPETSFDQAISNPPFYLKGKGTQSPEAGRERAVRLDAEGIAAWVRSAAKVLRPGGYATFVFATDRLDLLLTAMASRFGGLRIYPFWIRAGGSAKRVIVQGRKGSGAPTQVLAGMVLHNSDGSFTEDAEAVLRGGQAIDLDPAI
jgi:tRNA1(Val) A37 N6-methylase TrmN6